MQSLCFIEDEGGIKIADGTFKRFNFPFFYPLMVIRVLDDILNDMGYYLKLDSQAKKYQVIPKHCEKSIINAPLYRLIDDKPKFVKMYQTLAILPDNFNKAISAVDGAVQQTKLLEAARFEEMFNKEFIKYDNPAKLSTVKAIVYRCDNYLPIQDEVFFKAYIPDGYVQVCAIFHDEYSEIIYTKKFDAEGKELYIVIEEKFIPLAIGKKGSNIEKLKVEFNASQIYIIQKMNI